MEENDINHLYMKHNMEAYIMYSLHYVLPPSNLRKKVYCFQSVTSIFVLFFGERLYQIKHQSANLNQNIFR